jgi:hypothetical protein
MIITISFLGSKGNSLFAEVDDQRQKMKTVLQGERSHYTEMKKTFNSKEIEIRRLKRENFNIKQEMTACSSMIARGEQIALKSHKDRVNHLENENKKLETLLLSTEKKLIDLAQGQNLGWIESLITAANNESRELKDKLLAAMVENTSLADNLYKTQKELALARTDGVKIKLILSELIESGNLKIKEQNFLDCEIYDESIKIFSDETEEPQNKELSSTNLNESTIVLLGGRETLGKFVTPSPISLSSSNNSINKENFSKLSSEESIFVKSPVKPPRAINALKSLVNVPEIQDIDTSKALTQLNQIDRSPISLKSALGKADSITYVNEAKREIKEEIESSVEQEDQHRQTKKRTAIIVKLVKLPQKINFNNAFENL